MAEADVARLRDKVRALRRHARKYGSVFGASAHQWVFAPPLSEADIARIESRCNVALPADYRGFLADVSAGGAGPAYGLLTPERALALGDDLKTPFPWEVAHRPVPGDRDPTDAEYAAQAAGTLALCHEGCGYYHRLVITGPARGMMWIDARCSDQGFGPLGARFAEWYEKWADDVLRGGTGETWLDA